MSKNLESIQAFRPRLNNLHWMRVMGESFINQTKRMGDVILPPTPMSLTIEVLEKAAKLRGWEKEDYLRKATERAIVQMRKGNRFKDAGLAHIRAWVAAVEVLAAELYEADFTQKAMSEALTCTFEVARRDDGRAKFYPAEKDAYGKVTRWEPVIRTVPRYETRLQGVQGARWENNRLVRFVTACSTSVRELGEAELGISNEARLYLPEDYDRALNVINEEPARRNLTYNPDAEELWKTYLLETLDDVRTPNELMALYDETQRVWKAKGFRFHIYEEIHNEIVEFSRKVDKLAAHNVIGKWRTIGEGDASLPKVSKNFDRWLSKNPESKKAQSIQWQYENFLRREGLGVGFDGQPFDDHSKDALQQKGARATDGSLNAIDHCLYGSEVEDYDGNSIYSGPTHTAVANEESYLDELLELDGIGPKTVQRLHQAGLRMPDEVVEMSLDDINAIVNHRTRATILFTQVAKLVTEELSQLPYRDRLYIAMSRFGKSRGTSVDLLKPFVRDHAWIPTPAARRGDYSLSDGERSAWINELETFFVEDHEEMPPVAGFWSLEDALASILDL